MDTAIWIIIAVVVVIVILALVLLLLRQRKARRRVQAEEIRQNATQQVSTVRHREAVAEEADARARKAQAEADAKAAEAKRLQEQARHHQGHAAESRHEVESEFARADRLDPDVRRNADGRDTEGRGAHGRGADGRDDPNVAGRHAGQPSNNPIDPRHRPDADPRGHQTPPNAR
ncbi:MULTISPECIES: hypothetical protein [Gordonia]|uniref:Uncharacterized protein n=1 Tax=Gordonia hongkongensis TaxID=1701090 RepID=A0ABT6BWA8_9ACTN|nr:MULTISPECIES: hypothetical protein [Gordonia]MBN0975035.1 hypothetical protein [Gordonia sp. BP-119]MBN0985069.1 hypothetical protein [Gordonia sp. BP-94]MDF6101334.1 hypothetical protein [Gordonia hongkongensis]